MSIKGSILELSKPTEEVVIDGVSYIPSTVFMPGIPKFTIKDNNTFAVVNRRGESPRSYAKSSELGVYLQDTRHLSTLEMTFNGTAPIPLANEAKFSGGTVVFSMTNADMPRVDNGGRIPRSTFLIRRVLSLAEGKFFEIVTIRNFDSVSYQIRTEQWLSGGFNDIFEVRGFNRKKRGELLKTEEIYSEQGPISIFKYRGLDNVTRSTFVRRLFSCSKIYSEDDLIGYSTLFEIPAKGDLCLKTVFSFDNTNDGSLNGKSFFLMGIPETMEHLSKSTTRSPFSALSIETDNAILNRAIENAKIDIKMLLTKESSDILYPYAGTPWFSAPFGRDGMIAGYQLLPWHPEVARGVLDFSFGMLGKKIDNFSDEQPGKVFHELRRGEMANAREVPFVPYYGSVDSTPLCLILLYEYISWTRDIDRLQDWWPKALQALDWINKFGDADRDGFLEYFKQSPTGLINQGWKDSHDSVMHIDGRLAVAPIKLCEVQGYVFRAKMGMSALAKLMNFEDLSRQLRAEALRLKTKFIENFWDTERDYVYLALDARNEPCKVISSNMGHCLWSQLLNREQGKALTRHLMSAPMFSGHGIRTLSDLELAYNPLSYHNGSIWPHDNSMILEGFRYYNETSAIETLAIALFEVLETSEDFRLPELYCGFRKRGLEPPIPYEVACKPQAWAAGSVFLMIKSMLGLSMDPDQSHVIFHSPVLTNKIGELNIRNLRGRDWELDISIRSGKHGASVDIIKKSGKVRVLTVK